MESVARLGRGLTRTSSAHGLQVMRNEPVEFTSRRVGPRAVVTLKPEVGVCGSIAGAKERTNAMFQRVSDRTKSVECERHGQGYETFVCTHLRKGVACGYVSSTGLDRGDDPWPDAWCSVCEEVRAKEGGWNDVSEAFADIVLLCSGCYEDARRRNEQLPRSLELDMGRLDDDHAQRLIQTACLSTDEAQRALDDRTGFVSYPRWQFDADTRSLRFHGADTPDLVTPVSLVGSFSSKSDTWMWAWESNRVEPELLGDVWRLRTFGEVRGISCMSEGTWPAEEHDGWHMASLAAHLLQAQGGPSSFCRLAALRRPRDRRLPHTRCRTRAFGSGAPKRAGFRERTGLRRTPRRGSRRRRRGRRLPHRRQNSRDGRSLSRSSRPA